MPTNTVKFSDLQLWRHFAFIVVSNHLAFYDIIFSVLSLSLTSFSFLIFSPFLLSFLSFISPSLFYATFPYFSSLPTPYVTFSLPCLFPSLFLPLFSSLPDAQPTEAETAVWNQVSAVLEEAHGILAELQSYNGAGQEIREVSTKQLKLKVLNINKLASRKITLMCDSHGLPGWMKFWHTGYSVVRTSYRQRQKCVKLVFQTNVSSNMLFLVAVSW